MPNKRTFKNSPQFYKEKICLNVLAGSKENAADICEATDGNVLIGLLSRDYQSNEEAVSAMREYAKVTGNRISIGLGAGDPSQAKNVENIAGLVQPQHVNQVFTNVGATRSLLGQESTIINSLVSPSGKKGFVKVNTGAISSELTPAIVPVETAIGMIKDAGGNSLKYFPMNGLEKMEEYSVVAAKCAEQDFILEPTGGIGLDNLGEILQVALREGVPKVIPHIYSSIIDKETKLTKIEDVKKAMNIIEQIL
ncbi:2-dehydro-3-deoxy-phosphogluconate aldolase [Oceanobacillus manasiensis]|uniref:2-dehydro-3-deoxy-phosphogluconate aldolase n=1 Tax=Oceanobacillus manasiensis TaxID=586413 RepID=UPI000A52F820|nr:KDGP aldolase [Oceanobacillus manasiensis]